MGDRPCDLRCALRLIFRRIRSRGGAGRRGLCRAPADGGLSLPRQLVAARARQVASATALKLLRAGWPAFVVAWGGTLAAMWLLAQAIPEARPPIEVTADQGKAGSQLVSLLIPANLFADLTRNYVPAIVVFSLFY